MVLTANNPSSQQQRRENPGCWCFFPETAFSSLLVLSLCSKCLFTLSLLSAVVSLLRFSPVCLFFQGLYLCPSPLPSHLLRTAFCARPYADWCRDAVLQHKICTGWHNMWRATYWATEGGWRLIGGLLKAPANGTQPSPSGHPPLWLELLMELKALQQDPPHKHTVQTSVLKLWPEVGKLMHTVFYVLSVHLL